jgi:hypothetical protein
MEVPKLPNYEFFRLILTFSYKFQIKKLKGNIVIPKKAFSIKYQGFQFDLIPKKFEEEASENTIWWTKMAS